MGSLGADIRAELAAERQRNKFASKRNASVALSGGHSSDKWRGVMLDAKLKHRTELKTAAAWHKLGFAKRTLGKTPCDRPVDYIMRIHASDMSRQRFIDEFERPAKPVVISGLTDNWPANKDWTLPNILEKYGECKLKCGEDDDGYAIRVKAKHFIEYMKHPDQIDDSPLYIFDGTFGDDKVAKDILNSYSPPVYFRNTLFEMVDEDNRPPYRWFLLGPKRSGTTVHIDPLGTSAWNSIISGAKR